MGKRYELCPGDGTKIYQTIPPQGYSWRDVWENFEKSRIKPLKKECNKCGRKLTLSYGPTGDGDAVIYTMPPHKPKGWRID